MRVKIKKKKTSHLWHKQHFNNPKKKKKLHKIRNIKASNLQTICDYSIQAIINYKSPTSVRTYSLCHSTSQLHRFCTNLNVLKLLQFFICSPLAALQQKESCWCRLWRENKTKPNRCMYIRSIILSIL